MAKHCDDYIDDPAQPECLRRFQDYNRVAAVLKYPLPSARDAEWCMKEYGRLPWDGPVPVLFARHAGTPVRVTMASRFGDVGITEDLTAEYGYGKRVAVEDLTEFGTEPPKPKVVLHLSWNQTFVNAPPLDMAADEPAESAFGVGPMRDAFICDMERRYTDSWAGMHLAEQRRRERARPSNEQPVLGVNRAQRRADAARKRRLA